MNGLQWTFHVCKNAVEIGLIVLVSPVQTSETWNYVEYIPHL